jgi:LPS-assembly lipoprotein
MSKHFLLVVIAAAISLSGCGWHLRGQLPLADSINVLGVDANPGNFRDLLVDALQDANATVTDDFQAAKAVLRITDEEYRREVRTLDNRGKVNGYTLIYTISYEIVSANGELIRNTRSLTERADYNFDPVLVLGLEVEEIEIREGMEEELVLRILRQLNSIVFYPGYTRASGHA